MAKKYCIFQTKLFCRLQKKYFESKVFLFVEAGISGGEEGALLGPSIMPGGSVKAWEKIKPIFQSIAAKVEDGSPCCEWVGENGAGHFVKMVHNGIWIPTITTALNYFDGYRNDRLPASLLQAQRDYFGAHTYERVDKPRGEFFHTNWTGRGGDTASTTYDA